MPKATVIPIYVDGPKQGKKLGSIKLQDGTMYGVDTKILHLMRPHGTYEVEYSSRIWQNKEYHTISSVRELSPPAGGVTPISGSPSQYTSGYSGPNKDEQIFVTALLARFVQAGKIEPNAQAVIGAVTALRGAWGETFGKKAAPPPPPGVKDDMNEAIPF